MTKCYSATGSYMEHCERDLSGVRIHAGIAVGHRTADHAHLGAM